MKVGIMLMSDRGPDGEPWDWMEHLARCKTHGVEMVDLFDWMLQSVGMNTVEARKTLNDLGLSPSIYGVRTELMSPDGKVRQESLDAVKRGIEACHELGIGHLLTVGGQHASSGEEALKRYIEGLRTAADIASSEGITVSIENAGSLCHTDAELLRCVRSVGKPNMKVTFDGGNFVIAGCDPHQAAELLAPEVVHVHAKSFVRVTDESEGLSPGRPFKYCPVGEGLVDYQRIRDVVAASGFDGCMSFEPEGGEDSKWYESLDTLTRIVKGTQ